MRCEDVTRELASPAGAIPQAELAGHLAACPACAEWSRRAAQLDRLLEATRPLEPSPEKLDALWLAASAALDRAELAPAPLRLVAGRPGGNRRRWVAGAAILGLAQAAAILLAVWLPDRPAAIPAPDSVALQPPGPKANPADAAILTTIGLVRVPVESDVYRLPVVRIDAGRVDVIDTMPEGNLLAENSSFDGFGQMESRANQ